MQRNLCFALVACAVLPIFAFGSSASAIGVRLARAGDDAVVERSVATLAAELASHATTSEALARAYLARMTEIDSTRPLHSVIAINPHALDQARAADRRRAANRSVGPLDGIPILLKHNIESADDIPTTAGSLALGANVAHRDAPLVARLRRAGAVILGKTNLSEWANFRASNAISGWSAVGGLVRNPYALDRTACGSSAGTGAAIAASLAGVGVGTETDGSVTCPSSVNGLVGLKPTLGLVSRTGIVPISHHQDTAGPMGRNVGDVAALLNVIAGTDPADPATRDADRHRRDYVAALHTASLKGKRFGVLTFALTSMSPDVQASFEHARAVLRSQGAHIIELAHFKPDAALADAEMQVLLTDFKTDLNAYLATTPSVIRTRNLAQLIRFNKRSRRELSLFGQDIFERAQATTGPADPKYRAALQTCRRGAATFGIDALLARYRLDALIAPTAGPASRVDVIDGDNLGGGAAGSLAAVAGYPHLSVPMGYVRGLPIGLSFIGRAWSDAELLGYGDVFERTARVRYAPSYVKSIEETPQLRRLLAPAHVAQ